MKRHLCLALTLLLVNCLVNGQYKELLRNNSVLDMSKARLTDDVIVSLIMYSPVHFSIEDDSLAILRMQGVSESVIEAMVSAQNLRRIYRAELMKSDTVGFLSSAETRPDIYNTGANEYVPSIGKEEVAILTLNYVTPLIYLVYFAESEFLSFESKLAEWDKNVRLQTDELYRTRKQVLKTESDLRNMKNAGIELFGPDIIQTKFQLEIYRGNYNHSKEGLKNIGEQIQRWLKTEMNERYSSLLRSYISVIQEINKIESNPSFGEQPSEKKILLRTVNESTSDYLVYITEIMVWYQNWIKETDSLIADWNLHITNIIMEDKLLKSQLEPIESRIDQLRLNSRQNRKELSALKKQVLEIEKSRKSLVKKMEGDKKDLAAHLKETGKIYQMSLKQRFNDIIENIGYAFNERLAL